MKEWKTWELVETCKIDEEMLFKLFTAAQNTIAQNPWLSLRKLRREMSPLLKKKKRKKKTEERVSVAFGFMRKIEPAWHIFFVRETEISPHKWL